MGALLQVGVAKKGFHCPHPHPVLSLGLQFVPQRSKLPEFLITQPQLQVAETLSQSCWEYSGLHPSWFKGFKCHVRRSKPRRSGLLFCPSAPLAKQGCHSKISRTPSLFSAPEQWHRGFARERKAVRTESSILLPKGIVFVWSRVW